MYYQQDLATYGDADPTIMLTRVADMQDWLVTMNNAMGAQVSLVDNTSTDTPSTQT